MNGKEGRETHFSDSVAEVVSWIPSNHPLALDRGSCTQERTGCLRQIQDCAAQCAVGEISVTIGEMN